MQQSFSKLSTADQIIAGIQSVNRRREAIDKNIVPALQEQKNKVDGKQFMKNGFISSFFTEAPKKNTTSRILGSSSTTETSTKKKNKQTHLPEVPTY